jgi:hypothetical protein
MRKVKQIKITISSDEYTRRDAKALGKYSKGKFVSVPTHIIREDVRYENINLKSRHQLHIPTALNFLKPCSLDRRAVEH